MTNPICQGDETSSGGTVVSCQLADGHHPSRYLLDSRDIDRRLAGVCLVY